MAVNPLLRALSTVFSLRDAFWMMIWISLKIAQNVYFLVTLCVYSDGKLTPQVFLLVSKSM